MVEVEKSFADVEGKKTVVVVVVDQEQSFAVVEGEIVAVVKGRTADGSATVEKIVDFVAVLAAPETSVGYFHQKQD